jgi:hypothetical protein
MPFVRYMHELHALPALLPIAELLLGARDAAALHAHLLRPRAAVAATLGFGIAWLAFMLGNAGATGMMPYPFMNDMSPAVLAAFTTVCYTLVAFGVLALRRAIVWRAGVAVSKKAGKKAR